MKPGRKKALRERLADLLGPSLHGKRQVDRPAAVQRPADRAALRRLVANERGNLDGLKAKMLRNGLRKRGEQALPDRREVIPDAGECQRIVAELLDLSESSDPAGGEATAADKDAKALHALALLGRLNEQFAWALHHQAGRKEIEAEGEQPDGHEAELRGQDSLLAPAFLDREIIAEQVAWLVPGRRSRELAESLRALTTHGETRRLVRPSTKSAGKHGRADGTSKVREQLQRRARVWQEALRRGGVTAAQEQVAVAFGVTSQAMREWPKPEGCEQEVATLASLPAQLRDALFAEDADRYRALLKKPAHTDADAG